MGLKAYPAMECPALSRHCSEHDDLTILESKPTSNHLSPAISHKSGNVLGTNTGLQGRWDRLYSHSKWCKDGCAGATYSLGTRRAPASVRWPALVCTVSFRPARITLYDCHKTKQKHFTELNNFNLRSNLTADLN